jgi:hypothetical protein
MTQPPAIRPKRTEAGRLRAPLAAAVTAIVTEGLTIQEAANRVNMQRESVSRALLKPHVQAFKAGVKRAWLDNETGKAWLMVAHLANEAQSEDVRLKAAKVILDAAGELSGTKDANPGARSLVQIVVNHGHADRAADQTSAGVIELRRTPGRSSDQYELIDATPGGPGG